jgi:hypothetical protein
MMTYNLQKKAQQGAQQVAASPAEAMNLQKVMQQQDAIIARFNAELQQLQANAQTNPQAAQTQIQNITTQLQAAQQTRQQAYMALWNYNNSLNAQVRTQKQSAIQAILENDDKVLSSMSAEEYVAARDAFLRSAPKPGQGESIEEYKTRMKEWVYQYNPSGDLVDVFANRVVQMRQQELTAKQSRNKEKDAQREKNLQEQARRAAQRNSAAQTRRR